MARSVKVDIDKRSILKTESNLWIEMKNPKLKRPKYRLALKKKKANFGNNSHLKN